MAGIPQRTSGSQPCRSRHGPMSSGHVGRWLRGWLPRLHTCSVRRLEPPAGRHARSLPIRRAYPPLPLRPSARQPARPPSWRASPATLPLQETSSALHPRFRTTPKQLPPGGGAARVTNSRFMRIPPRGDYLLISDDPRLSAGTSRIDVVRTLEVYYRQNRLSDWLPRLPQVVRRDAVLDTGG